MLLSDFLAKLGLTDKETQLYLGLAELGVQPASTIARRCGIDRVFAYKLLKRMASQGLVTVHVRDDVQCFGVSGPAALEELVREKSSSYTQMLEEIPSVEKELRALSREERLVPKLEIYEGKAGMKNFFRDLLQETEKQGILHIRMLTSNTFEQQLGNVPLSNFMQEFYDSAKEKKLTVDIIEASGTLLPERIRRIALRDFRPDEYPASRGATNVFLVGSALYLACYGDSQIGLKIKQEQMSQIFHFFFDAVSGKK